MSKDMCQRCGLKEATVTTEAGRFCGECDELNDVEQESAQVQEENAKLRELVQGYHTLLRASRLLERHDGSVLAKTKRPLAGASQIICCGEKGARGMTWEAMTPEQRDLLIHTKIMQRTQEPCHDGELNPYLGGYWRCSCGWVSDFYIGEGSTEHTIPVPSYTQSMDAAWLVLQHMAARYDAQAEYLDEVFDEFKSRLFDETGDEIYPATKLLLDMAKWTPDHICKEALQALGVEVE